MTNPYVQDPAVQEITVDQYLNLARNGSFEEWPDSGLPSGWSLVGAGATAVKDTVNVHLGSSSVAVTRAGADARLTQDAATQAGGLSFLRGKAHTLAAFVRKPPGSRARIGLYDGVDQKLSGFSCTDNNWERLEISKTIDNNATKLEISLEVIDFNATVQFDGVMLVEGHIAPGFRANPSDAKDPTVSDTTPPSVPTGLALSPGSTVLNDGTFEASITATWTANPEGDVSGYMLRIKKTSEGATDWTPFSTDKVTRLVFRGLQPNIQYEVQISAFDLAGNPSAFSSSVMATTAADPGAPATPTGLTLTAFALAVALTWNPNAERDVAYYELQRADNSAFTTNLVTRQVDGTAYVDNTQDTVSRFYRIRAVRRSRQSDGSSLVASPYTTAVQGGGLLVSTTVIQDLAITTAKIGDLQVATAKIQDLTVTTLKIANNAVSNRAFGSTDLTTGIANSPSWTDLVSLSFTPTGGDVLVIGKAILTSVVAVGQQNTMRLRILRDSTELDRSEYRYQVDGSDDSAQTMSGTVVVINIEAPAPGTYTYKLQAAEDGGTSESAVNARLQVYELKK